MISETTVLSNTNVCFGKDVTMHEDLSLTVTDGASFTVKGSMKVERGSEFIVDQTASVFIGDWFILDEMASLTVYNGNPLKGVVCFFTGSPATINFILESKLLQPGDNEFELSGFKNVEECSMFSGTQIFILFSDEPEDPPKIMTTGLTEHSGHLYVTIAVAYNDDDDDNEGDIESEWDKSNFDFDKNDANEGEEQKRDLHEFQAIVTASSSYTLQAAFSLLALGAFAFFLLKVFRN